MPKTTIMVFICALIISNIFTFLSMNIRLEDKTSELTKLVDEMKDIVYLYAEDSMQDVSRISGKIESTNQDLESLNMALSENTNKIDAIKVNHSKMWNNFNILFDLHAGEWKERWVKTPEGPTLLLED
ncbi:MAG: hypothetical protein MK028_05505 [Dehalococcoidia bacterium]|nr:hypothetical protein [Chloroflexota bacterium]MCH2525764.1 hypothetical protein [Dehalococcoidia bacterium]MQF99309.1 hypothetical protein [SAR202 cluster bacterium]|tara:strand:+ start:604 stop:987 length:384 start_codon:yes stop_codon:yes gene_type:complete